LTLLKPFQYDTAIPEWLMKTTCAAFGVPPSVLGGYTADVNRATADSQDHQGDQGVRSLLEWFRGRVLNTVIGRELGYPDVELRFLWGDETDRLQQAQTHKIYVEMGALTPEQALRDAYGDTYEYLGGTEPEAPEEDDADTDADEWLKMGAPTLTKADDTPNAWIERAKRFFRRVYGNQFDRVLEAVEEAGDNVQTALATFWATETPRIIRAVLPFYDQVLRTGIEQGAATVNIGVDWDMVNEAVLDLAREEAQTFAERMVTTGQGATAKAIAQWIELGGDMPELIDRVRTTWTGPRPDTAAVTEVTRLYSQGQRRAWENTGVVKEWEWMTAEDEMVCPVCNPLNGKRFPISDTTNLPPAHPNCRCDVAPITMTPEELRNG
jgi:SPP1 gp7 family putative phage head morphogenesis protein